MVMLVMMYANTIELQIVMALISLERPKDPEYRKSFWRRMTSVTAQNQSFFEAAGTFGSILPHHDITTSIVSKFCPNYSDCSIEWLVAVQCHIQ